MRIAAIYGSKYGQVERVMRRIADVLERDGNTVTVARGDQLPPGFTLDQFDAVLVGASIILGRYQKYIRRFATAHAHELGRVPSAFVSVNGTSPESQPAWRQAARAYVDAFIASTGWNPSHIAMFSGALRYTRYGVFTKWAMQRISKRVGAPTDASRDYEFTDWAAVDRFAGELAAAWLPHPQPAYQVG